MCRWYVSQWLAVSGSLWQLGTLRVLLVRLPVVGSFRQLVRLSTACDRLGQIGTAWNSLWQLVTAWDITCVAGTYPGGWQCQAEYHQDQVLKHVFFQGFSEHTKIFYRSQTIVTSFLPKIRWFNSFSNGNKSMLKKLHSKQHQHLNTPLSIAAEQRSVTFGCIFLTIRAVICCENQSNQSYHIFKELCTLLRLWSPLGREEIKLIYLVNMVNLPNQIKHNYNTH